MLRRVLSSASSMATGVNTHPQSLKLAWFIIHLTVLLLRWRLAGGFTLPGSVITKISRPHTLRPVFSSVYFDAFISAWAAVTKTRTISSLTGTSVRRGMMITGLDRKSTRLNSSHDQISYAV